MSDSRSFVLQFSSKLTEKDSVYKFQIQEIWAVNGFQNARKLHVELKRNYNGQWLQFSSETPKFIPHSPINVKLCCFLFIAFVQQPSLIGDQHLSLNTLLKPKRHSLRCHGFMVHALLLRMHTNVVYFRVMRRLYRREWNWLYAWTCIHDNGHVITARDVWL